MDSGDLKWKARTKARNFNTESPNVIGGTYCYQEESRGSKTGVSILLSKQRNWERKTSEDDDVPFSECAQLPVKCIGQMLVRKVKPVRYKSGHNSYTRATK